MSESSWSESFLDSFHQIGNSNQRPCIVLKHDIKSLFNLTFSLKRKFIKLWKKSISQTLGPEWLSHAASFVYRRNQYYYEAKWRASSCPCPGPVIQGEWNLTVKSRIQGIQGTQWLSLGARILMARPQCLNDSSPQSTDSIVREPEDNWATCCGKWVWPHRTIRITGSQDRLAMTYNQQNYLSTSCQIWGLIQQLMVNAVYGVCTFTLQIIPEQKC